jgi:hypothetical protein
MPAASRVFWHAAMTLRRLPGAEHAQRQTLELGSPQLLELGALRRRQRQRDRRSR